MISLGSESTDGCNFSSSIVVGNVEVGRDHDVAISSIGEGIAIGLVQMAVASGVVTGAVAEV